MGKKYKYEVTIDNMPQEVKEQILLLKQKFKEDLAIFPEINNSWYILRFLRARNFDQQNATEMLQNFFKYRKSKNFDKIRNIKMPETFLKDLYIRGYCNVNKNGLPIGIERVGFTKTKVILDMYTLEFLDDYFFQQWERFINIILPVCSQKAGRRIEKVISVLDLKHLNINKVFDTKFKQFLKDITHVSQNYYPELLEKMYIINAPLLFKGIWQVIKITLDKQTRNKINIFWGGGKKELKKEIDEKNLVEFLGGSFNQPLYKQCGPWSQSVKHAEIKDQLFLPQNDLWIKYYLTEEEKLQFNIQTFNPTKTEVNIINKNDSYKDTKNYMTQNTTLKTRSDYLNSINSVNEKSTNKQKVNQTTILVKLPKVNPINQIIQFRKSFKL